MVEIEVGKGVGEATGAVRIREGVDAGLGLPRLEIKGDKINTKSMKIPISKAKNKYFVIY